MMRSNLSFISFLQRPELKRILAFTRLDISKSFKAFKHVIYVIISGLIARYLVFLVRFKYLQNRKKLPWPPGPTPLPVLGNLNLVLGENIDGNKNPLVHHALAREAKNHQGIYGIWMGSFYTVVVTKPTIAEEAFCTHRLENGQIGRGDVFTDRAANQSSGGHHVPSMSIMTRDGKGIAMSTGAYWRKVRGRLVAHITNKRSAEMNAGLVLEEVRSVVAEFKRKILRGECLDNLNQQLKRESLNIVMRLLFNKRYGSNPPKDFTSLVHCVEWFFCNLASGNPSDMVPFLRIFPNAFLREAKATAALRDEVLGRLIAEHRAEWEQLRREGKMSSRSQGRGMVDQFFFDNVDGFEVTNAEGKTETMYLTEDEIHVCVWDVLFAMTDTSASTNEWMIYNLVNHPDVQEKVHEELDRVVGSNRLPALDDRENLPYLWAVIKEVMRFRIISPIMAPHYSKCETTLHDVDGKEYYIPQGTTLYMHGYSMGLDPELWDCPEEFRPERWFSERNEGLDLHGQNRRICTEHYKFIPFSLGPRMCPGYAIAKVAQFLQAATLLHCLRFSLSEYAISGGAKHIDSNGKLDMTENWGLTIMPRRYGELGMIAASLRPASHLCHASVGDIDYKNPFLRLNTSETVSLAVKKPLMKEATLLRFVFSDVSRVPGLQIGGPLRVKSYKSSCTGQTKHLNCVVYPTSTNSSVGFIELVVRSPILSEYGKRDLSDFDILADSFLKDEIEIEQLPSKVDFFNDLITNGSAAPSSKKMIGMIANGLGIAPVLQILRTVLENDRKAFLFSLVYVNNSEEDAILCDELKFLAESYADCFKLTTLLDSPQAIDSGESKSFSKNNVEEYMPPTFGDAIVLLSAETEAFRQKSRGFLEELGFKNEVVVEV